MRRPEPMERMFQPGLSTQVDSEPSPWRVLYSHGVPRPLFGATLGLEHRPLPDWNAGPYLQDVPKVHGR